jgi:hypothetical protein
MNKHPVITPEDFVRFVDQNLDDDRTIDEWFELSGISDEMIKSLIEQIMLEVFEAQERGAEFNRALGAGIAGAIEIGWRLHKEFGHAG